jgi:hypothetical protein
MDFFDQVKSFAATIPAKLDSVKTEEATKHFLVMPFIQQILGYDTFNPNEVMPEYDANVGASTNFKLDYALFQDGKPAILIECKCRGVNIESDRAWSQLFSYFMATEARIGVLTDGVSYKFYADLEKPNKMDKTPFLEVNFLDLNDFAIRELAKLTKGSFDLETAITAASELKYVGGIKTLLSQQFENPDDDFVKYFFQSLCPENRFQGKLKEDFISYTRRATKEFIRDQIASLLDEATERSKAKIDEGSEAIADNIEEPENDSKQTAFTEEEREGFYILKSILSAVIDPERVTYKDTLSYCNILLDGNSWRPIVRLHFNNSKNKKLEIFSVNEEGKKVSEFFAIDALGEIYRHAERFKSIVAIYDQPKGSEKNES